MQASWFPTVLVQACDLAEATGLELPFGPVVADPGGALRLDGGGAVRPEVAMRDALALLVLSAAARPGAAALAQDWTTRFDSAPEMLDLADRPAPGRRAEALADLARLAVD